MDYYNDERYWNIKLLNKWFAISSILFLLSIIWMFVFDNDDELLIANSDQYVEFSSENFNAFRRFVSMDASVFTFNAVHPKWSFVKVNSRGVAIEVAEKNPISNIATCGIYYYRHGCDFVKYAHQMIEKDVRVNGEFYICPVYNELIDDGHKIRKYEIPKIWSFAVPEELDYFIKNLDMCLKLQNYF